MGRKKNLDLLVTDKHLSYSWTLHDAVDVASSQAVHCMSASYASWLGVSLHLAPHSSWLMAHVSTNRAYAGNYKRPDGVYCVAITGPWKLAERVISLTTGQFNSRISHWLPYGAWAKISLITGILKVTWDPDRAFHTLICQPAQ